MSTYRIPLYGTVTAIVEVESDSYEEAVEYALENAPQTSFTFAQFDAVDQWEAAIDYYVDGKYINPDAEASL